MPNGLTLRSTLLLAALAFGLTFATQALTGGGGPSAAKPAATQGAPEPVADVAGAEPDLRLAAAKTVPALRNPRKQRKRRVRVSKPAREPRVQPAPDSTPTPVMPAPTVEPTPIPAPRYIPPAPRQPTPKPPATKPTPAPTSAPPSGEFDTTGDS